MTILFVLSAECATEKKRSGQAREARRRRAARRSPRRTPYAARRAAALTRRGGMCLQGGLRVGGEEQVLKGEEQHVMKAK